MKIAAFSKDGKSFDLGKPRTLKLSYSFDTPAHSLLATFPCENPLPEFVKVQVKNAGKLIFEGSVDEQTVSVYKNGCLLEIDARSAALLLDNEAYPATYHAPSLQEICRIHAEPYGIKGVLGNGILDGDFTISKGMSEWEVICEFCNNALNVQPQITPDGYLDARKNSFTNEKAIIISNGKAGSYRFFKASVKNKKYGVISQIIYKSETGGTYKYGFTNPGLTDKTINVRRLVNLSELQNYERRSKVEKVFGKSLAGSFEITAEISADFNFSVGTPINFYDKKLGNFEGLRIYEKEYVINSVGEICRVKLRPEKHFQEVYLCG